MIRTENINKAFGDLQVLKGTMIGDTLLPLLPHHFSQPFLLFRICLWGFRHWRDELGLTGGYPLTALYHFLAKVCCLIQVNLVRVTGSGVRPGHYRKITEGVAIVHTDNC